MQSKEYILAVEQAKQILKEADRENIRKISLHPSLLENVSENLFCKLKKCIKIIDIMIIILISIGSIPALLSDFISNKIFLVACFMFLFPALPLMYLQSCMYHTIRCLEDPFAKTGSGLVSSLLVPREKK